MVIRLATRAEIPDCVALLHAHGEQEHTDLGVAGWTHPRVRGVVQADADAGRLYAVQDGTRVVATFALCDDPDAYFAAARWADPQARATYLHRLVIASGRQGAGLGSWCVHQAEQLAAKGGNEFLRLDTLERDSRAVAFYRRLGYAYCGVAPVESGIAANPTVNLICFEKRLAAHNSTAAASP